MPNKSFRLLKLASIATAALALSACVGNQNDRQTLQDSYDKVIQAEGVFVEHVDAIHVEIQGPDGRKIYKVPDKYAALFQKVKENEELRFEYQKNDIGELVIKKAETIEPLIVKKASTSNKTNSSTETNVQKKITSGTVLSISKSTLTVMINGTAKSFSFDSNVKKVVSSLEEGDQVEITYTEKNTDRTIMAIVLEEKKGDKKLTYHTKDGYKTAYATKEESDLGYHMYLMNDFSLENAGSKDKLSFDKNKSTYATIEIKTDDPEIKKERWQAAGELKSAGDLKELKGSDIPKSLSGSEFVFTAANGNTTHYIAIKEVNGTFFKFSVQVDNDLDEEEAKLWSMMGSLE